MTSTAFNQSKPIESHTRGGEVLFSKLSDGAVNVNPLSDAELERLPAFPVVARCLQDEVAAATRRAISCDFSACHPLVFYAEDRPIVLGHMSVNASPRHMSNGWGLYLHPISFSYSVRKFTDMSVCFPDKSAVTCINLTHTASNLRSMAYTDSMIKAGLAQSVFNRVIHPQIEDPSFLSRKVIADADQKKIFVFPTNGDNYLELSLRALIDQAK